MPQDLKDYVSANGGIEGQVAPTFASQPGALIASALATVAGQISTQTNTTSTGSNGIISIVNAQQILAVAGPTYNSPGGILNKVTPGGVGGGP
jgi:hypothetical protein